eukprot:5088478-Amphidinium_carterae.1
MALETVTGRGDQPGTLHHLELLAAYLGVGILLVQRAHHSLNIAAVQHIGHVDYSFITCVIDLGADGQWLHFHALRCPPHLRLPLVQLRPLAREAGFSFNRYSNAMQ